MSLPAVPAYSGQAGGYDTRAGLPDEACAAIAARVRALGDLRPGDLVVDVAAGTGQIGRWLARAPIRYVGFDLAGEMLDVFRARLDAQACDSLLAQADGNRRWPVGDGTARLVFISRAVHLLDARHVVDEVHRAADPGGATLLLGRVQHGRSGAKTRVRDEMRRRLTERGLVGRDTGKSGARILEACRSRGASAVEAVAVARWTVATTPRQSIESWRRKDGLWGMALAPAVKAEVLDEVEAWADARGDLDVATECEEAYVLEGARIPATSESEATR